MAKLSLEDFRTATQGKGIDDVISEIKKLPLFGLYEAKVKETGEDSAKFLEATTLLVTMGNDMFHALVTSVSLNILFALVDQKLRADILQQNGENNEKSN